MLCAACSRVIMAASNESLVEGIGDEVLLFGAFLFLSACMVCYVSLRGERRGPEQAARGREGEQQQRDNAQSHEQPDSPPSSSSGSHESGPPEDPTGTTTDQSGPQSDDSNRQDQNSDAATLRSRFPQTQEARSGEEDETRASNAGSPEESLPIRLILPNNSTLQVNVQPSTTLGEIRRSYFQEQLAEHRPVRFIYQGRVLDDDSQTLLGLGIRSNHAIHLHIGRPRPPDEGGAPNQNFGPQPPGEMMDLSRYFLPLFGLILAICWVSMFCFPHVFSLLTKFLLFLLSLGYVFLTYVSTWTTPTDT